MRRLKTLFRILLQTGGHNMFKGRWSQRLEGADRLRVFFQNGGRQRDLTLSLKRLVSSCHLVKHGAERKNVAARIRVLSLDLLWRHVLDGANDAAPSGQLS